MIQNIEGIFLNEPSEVYHADSVYEIPSLSSSLAKLLITETPRHVWWSSRRLNPKWRNEYRKEWDRGTIAHALILNSGDQSKIEKVKAPDWRSKSAKELRDAIRANGGIPILESDYDELMEMRDAALEQLNALESGNPFAVGHSEVVIRWKETLIAEGGEIVEIWCRARADWHNPESENLYDLKTSASSMNPALWARWRSWDVGAPYQAAFYRRGLRRLAQLGIVKQYDPDFLFLLAESKAPYCVGLVNFPPDIRQRFGEKSADEKLTAAMIMWARCLQTAEWPGYDTSVYIAEGARPIVTSEPTQEQAPPDPKSPQFHVNSDDIARGSTPEIDAEAERDMSWAEQMFKQSQRIGPWARASYQVVRTEHYDE